MPYSSGLMFFLYGISYSRENDVIMLKPSLGIYTVSAYLFPPGEVSLMSRGIPDGIRVNLFSVASILVYKVMSYRHRLSVMSIVKGYSPGVSVSHDLMNVPLEAGSEQHRKTGMSIMHTIPAMIPCRMFLFILLSGFFLASVVPVLAVAVSVVLPLSAAPFFPVVVESCDAVISNG